jgi:hypothetical protein
MTNKTEQQNITIDALNAAHIAQNANYIERNAAPELNKNGMNPNIASAVKIWYGMTPAQFSEAQKLFAKNVDFCEKIANTRNVKVTLRLPALISFAITGDVNDLKGSARTAVAQILALLYGATTRTALQAAATGLRYEGEAFEINAQQARKITKVISCTGLSSESTQHSVTFAKGNMADILGIVKAKKPGDKNPMPEIDANHAFVKRLVKTVSELSEIAIEDLVTTRKRK